MYKAACTCTYVELHKADLPAATEASLAEVKPTGPLILAAIVGVEVVARSGLVALLDLPALLDLLALLESWCSSTPAVSPAVMPRLCRLSFSPSAVDRNDHSEQPRDCSGPAASTTGGERTLCIGTQTLGTQTPRLEAWPVFPVVRSRARVVTRVVTGAVFF